MKAAAHKKRLKILITAAVILAIVMAAVAAAVYFFGTASVYFYTPSDTVQVRRALKGSEVSLDPPAPIEGYSFVGWENEWGELESRQSISLYEDTYYSAVYSVALNSEEHAPYMFADEYGLFRPNDTMTKGEAAQMLYSLLSVKVKGSDNFLDVSADDACYKATAALKELNVVSGSRFHPDDPITRRELLEMLSAFYPCLPEKYEFADVDSSDPDYTIFCTAAAYGWIESGNKTKLKPDAELTRYEIAALMNRVLGRSAAGDRPNVMGFVLDVTPDDSFYSDVAEAVIDHSYSTDNGNESWTANASFDKKERGLYLAGTELYFINGNGFVLKNYTENGFSFDENGRYTCGMPELDELVQELLSGLIDESMDQTEMLEAIYYYTVNHFSYLKRNIYDFRDTSWVNEEAYAMLTTGCGNCYCYAAVFYQLARALGFDAQIYSGYIGIERSKHGWVEIELEGEPYIFDPEMEMAYMKNHGQKVDMFMMSYKEARKWAYTR